MAMAASSLGQATVVPHRLVNQLGCHHEAEQTGHIQALTAVAGHRSQDGEQDLTISSVINSTTKHRSMEADQHSASKSGALEKKPQQWRFAFVYGTLKQGFSNHWLIEEHIGKGNAKFVGFAQTKHRYPLICGPFQVPFLLHVPSQGWHVRGEVYEINGEALEHLDELEGIDKGHYMRLPITLTDLELDPSYFLQGDRKLFGSNGTELQGEAYFAHEEYTPVMAKVCSMYLDAYTHMEAATYIRRKDRPSGHTFLEHVRHWIDQQCGTEELEILP